MMRRLAEMAMLALSLVLVLLIGALLAGCFSEQDPTAPRQRATTGGSTRIIVRPVYMCPDPRTPGGWVECLPKGK